MYRWFLIFLLCLFRYYVLSSVFLLIVGWRENFTKPKDEISTPQCGDGHKFLKSQFYPFDVDNFFDVDN